MSRLRLQWLLGLLLVSSQAALAAPKILWQIGAFDGSSGEFARPTIPAGQVFEIGRSQTKDWGFRQRAMEAGKETSQSGEAIEFALPNTPVGVYRLKIGLIAETARVPLVQVEVNGHRGWFYQHPALDYRAGNGSSAFFPQYSTDVITAEIPSRFLHQGTNRFTLTAIDDPLAANLPGGHVLDEASISYDAIALENDATARETSGITTIEITPTVFYKSEAKQLAEVVSVTVSWDGLDPHGMVALSASQSQQTQPFAPGREFGEQRLEFLLPEFSAGTRAEGCVQANGLTRRVVQTVAPAKKWTVYLVPHEHLDVGYSDYQWKVAELQSHAIDDALDMIEQHPEFRYTLDGFWPAGQFLLARSQSDQDRLYRAVQQKKLFVPAEHSSLLTGFPTAEVLIRSFYNSHRFFRQHGGAWDHANITDVPSYSWSYASVLAASGLKYFVAGSDNYRGPILQLAQWHQKSPFWWEGPDGNRILMWYSRHYHQARSVFGLPPLVATGYEGLPNFLQIYQPPEYKASAVLMYGTQVENTALYPQQAELAEEWNTLFAYPRLEYSGFAHAMEAIMREFGTLPVVRGDGGPYWEDGIASDAYYAAVERTNERRAPAAEILASLAALLNPRIRPEKEVLDRIWENLVLADEHTWEAANAISDPNNEETVGQRRIKESHSVDAQQDIDYVSGRAMTAISDQIELRDRWLMVFNPLNWERDSLVQLDLNKGFELVDVETGQVVPHEVTGDDRGFWHVRFMARGVPSLGYRSYTVRRTRGRADQKEAGTAMGGETLENSFYRVVLDPQSGAVRGIYDKQLGRELVDTASPYRFGQYVYVTGADKKPNRLVQYRTQSPLAELETHGASEGKLISISTVPFGTIARLESRAVNTPKIATEIVLFDSQKKIEFIEHIQKTEVFTKEGVYFAFPFAIDKPQFRYEVQNGTVDPARDMLRGANLEWFSAQNWAGVAGGGVSAALIAPDSFLWTFGDIVRGTWPIEFGQRRAALFSYVMNNYWDTNYRAGQGGEFTFRYVATSAPALDPGALNHLGWEETMPLELDRVKAQDKASAEKRSLPGAKFSFLAIDAPNVLLSALKAAEDGSGYIIRFLETSGVSTHVQVTSAALQFSSARLCNAVEDCGEQLPVSSGGFGFQINPHQIVTVRVEAKSAIEH